MEAELERLRRENEVLRAQLGPVAEAPPAVLSPDIAPLRYDGQVAVVTGAGSGLGRSYALLLASRGAAVVVNDLGGGVDGAGAARQPLAEQVVSEIRAAGGAAVASTDSVEDGEKIIATALEAFGGVHIVVNNAGIAFPRAFEKLTRAEWDRMLAVHATGTFAVTQAAWPLMKAQGYGRVVVTSSPAGLFGAAGASPYCAAKLAVVGLMHGIQAEGARHGIRVNAIAPQADTRMTREFGAMVRTKRDYQEGMATADDPAYSAKATELGGFGPAHVAALVCWLCHEACNSRAGVYEAGGGFYRRTRWEATRGLFLTPVELGHGAPPLPEHIEARKAALLDFSAPVVPETGTGHMGDFAGEIQRHLDRRTAPRL
jgi:NAD(P)-dependent dehydrogenase (short-subunit alcohol dehydrogenase family)